MIKLALFTGARAEYGILKGLIKFLNNDSAFDISLLVGGIHLLKKFGNTYKEIESDGFCIKAKIPFYSENLSPSHQEFSMAITRISDVLEQDNYDALFIVGDRFEAYAAALAAHFTNTPILHFGGGTITRGAVDNIYRYNISNLAKFHFATSKGNYERLVSLPVIQKQNVYFTGSIAIDSIKEFLSKVNTSIEKLVPGLKKDQYILITFHPATNVNEPIPQILEHAVNYIIKNGYQVLMTYPNNDPGANEIVETIQKIKADSNVFVKESLGAIGYYSALLDCRFVLGNSSSGIIEAPYFKKLVINVGMRQDGREKDEGVFDVPAETILVEKALKKMLKEKLNNIANHSIYGHGNSIEKIVEILNTNFL